MHGRTDDRPSDDVARADQRALARAADDVARLIVATDLPAVDIALARARVREQCEALFPDRLDLFDRLYEARWDRLWMQWREPESAGTAESG
jgi:hypothetical protein